MKQIKNLHDVIKHKLCISCGACVGIAPPHSMRMGLDEKQGIYKPEIVDPSAMSGSGIEFSVCPGPGLRINYMSERLFGADLPVTPEFGRYRSAVAAQSTDSHILQRASSGGVMTTIALWLLEQGVIAGATVARFQKDPTGPRTVSYIARNRKELLHAQGSKYCPTTTNALIRECRETGGAYLFIGTPCQVGALRLAIDRDPALEKIFPFTMANFCGGYRDFRYLDGVIRNYGSRPEHNRFFRFRGGGWPGSMLAEDSRGKRSSRPYPSYVSADYVAKQKRCVLCIDGTGQLADFACGDAWIDRFTKGAMGPGGWSIAMARSRRAQEVLDEIREASLIKTTPLSHEDLLYSQRYNLSSKISRQKKRMKVLKSLGRVVTQWDIELPEGNTTYRKELTVLLQKTNFYQGVRLFWRKTPVFKFIQFIVHALRAWLRRA